MTRYRRAIDAQQVESLAAIGCTVSEIAAFCRVSRKTLERRCADAIEVGREHGKASLRRMQWRRARAGSAAMLIWLGKQLLGQREMFHTDITSAGQRVAAGVDVVGLSPALKAAVLKELGGEAERGERERAEAERAEQERAE